jgi:hypothetical protein
MAFLGEVMLYINDIYSTAQKSRRLRENIDRDGGGDN